ncbi:hypothetical protein RB195_003834 [Necator americanus]|uniref:Uncharacterized protein n=1 Tax=Necator americanus TaxID=51031 RepID=A0ABR1DR49_NECAM
MKLLLILVSLTTTLLYVRSLPIDGEHGGDHDTDNHLSEKSGEEDPSENHEHHHTNHDAETDTDSVDEETPEDFQLEEVNEDEKCEEKHTEGDDDKEEHVDEETKTHKKMSLKDHAHEDQKIGKRSIRYSDELYENERLRYRRSRESDEDKSEGLEHHEFHPHIERRRRDTHEQHSINKRSSSSEEPHHPFKRSSGHRAPGGHEHIINKRNTEDAVPGETEELDEPTFASDDVEQVDSPTDFDIKRKFRMSALLQGTLKKLHISKNFNKPLCIGTLSTVRVKRVSRAGSSHKPRVMNKNKGNSRAGQADTAVENE